MYNYIDFDFNFTFNKAMKEKVPGDRGDLLSARVSKILIAALYLSIYFFYIYICSFTEAFIIDKLFNNLEFL